MRIALQKGLALCDFITHHSGLPSAGVSEHVEITEGEKGLPKVVLSHSCGAKAEVCWSTAPF